MAPMVEGSLDNRFVDVSPLSVTPRVRDVSSHILAYTEYTPVGIIPTSWAQCWEYHSSCSQRLERMLGDVRPKLIIM